MLDKIKIEVVDLTEDIEDIKVEFEDQNGEEVNHSPSDISSGESSGHQLLSRERFNRNIDKSIEKAIADIKKGQSLIVVASHYGIPQDILYNKLVSRSLPPEDKILTQAEECSLIKWIIKSNTTNTLVFKHHLMEKVGKLKKVMNISPIFAKSKFGRKWYDYFMKNHPEIYENEGLLLPVDKILVRSAVQADIKSKAQLPDQACLDLLTRDEEANLVEWIITSNKENSLVFKYQLMKRVCRMSTVAKSTPGFAKSKFGKMWYLQFLKKHPEIYENDELLLPSDNLDKTAALMASCNIERAFVALHDFRKIKKSPFKMIRKDTYIQKEWERDDKEVPEKNISENIKVEESSAEDIHDEEIFIKELAKACDNDDASSNESGIESDHSSSDSINDTSCKTLKSVEQLNSKGESPICNLCAKSFYSLAKLKRHILSKHEPRHHKRSKCFDCKKWFPSTERLKEHIKAVHANLDNYHHCEQCGQPFKFKTSLRKHQRTVHESMERYCVRFYCDICNKGFRHKNSLEAHIMYGHLKQKKQFPCDICKKTFIKPSLMLRHRLRHSKIKPMECMHCGKTYPRKYLLREHIQKLHKAEEDEKV